MSETHSVVLTAVRDRAEAETLARWLVNHRLAACVQITAINSFYLWKDELQQGRCGDFFHPFTPDDLVPDTASLLKVVKSLAINERCFVTILDRVGAIITLSDLEKPPMRMFLSTFPLHGRHAAMAPF